MLCSRFQDNTFWTDFQKRIDIHQEDIPEAIENFKEMVQDCIQDYFANHDAPRSYFLLNKLDTKLQDLFDSLEHSKLGENQVELLCQLRQQIMEDESLRQIKEEIAYESSGHHDELHLSHQKTSEEKSPVKAKKCSSPGFSMQRFRRRSTAATERGSLKTMEFSTGRKTAKEVLTLREKESTGDVSDIQKKENIEISFDSEVEDKFDVLRMTKSRLDKYLSRSEHKLPTSTINAVEEQEHDIQTVEDEVANTKEKFFELLGKMREDFQEQRIEDACEGKQNLMEHVTAHSSDEQMKEWFDLYLKANQAFLAELDLWNKDIQNVVQQLNDEEGYRKYECNKQSTIRYKIVEGGKTIIKMESIVEVPLINILSLMYEANGYSKWVPSCKESKLVKPLQKAAFAYWLHYGLPAPISDRECYCLGIGVDRLNKNGSILLISRSVDTNNEILKKYNVEIPKKPKYLPMEVQIGMEIVPLTETKVKVRVVSTFDAHVKFASNGMLRWATKKIAKNMFKKLLVKSKNLKGTFWEKSMEENKEFYQWLEEKINKSQITK